MGANTPTTTDPAIATFLRVLSIRVSLLHFSGDVLERDLYSVHKSGTQLYWVLHTVVDVADIGTH